MVLLNQEQVVLFSLAEGGGRMDKLAHALLDLGFFSALGTSENTVGVGPLEFVRRGPPNTVASKNGIAVVYDEEGRPWIIDTHLFTVDMISKLDSQFHLKHEEVYVPHAEDGGDFLFRVLPSLQN
jgi:hypothetical protein